MNAKQYLNKIRLYDTRINAKLNERQHLRELVTSITTSLKADAGSSGGNQDKLGSIVARMVDLEAEIDRDVDGLVSAKKDISALLDEIENYDQYDVLTKRYVQYKKWEQIACEMNMSYRNVCRVHGKALQTVTVLLEERSNEL